MLDLLLSQLTAIMAIATSVERVTEVFKKVYLPLKNKLLNTPNGVITVYEKQLITMILSMIICVLIQCRIEITSINCPLVLQYIITGLITSLGSNLLHDLINLVTAIKNSYNSQ